MVCLLSLNSDRGVAQLGSALLWGSRGRGFKSRRSDRSKTVCNGRFWRLLAHSKIGDYDVCA